MKFHISDILSITTGRLVSQRHIKGVYEILTFMTGDNVFTHQIPRFIKECAPELLKQFPELVEVDATTITTDNPSQWLQNIVGKFGAERDVMPLSGHVFKDPLDELEEMLEERAKR